jgi:hypothetical protein
MLSPGYLALPFIAAVSWLKTIVISTLQHNADSYIFIRNITQTAAGCQPAAVWVNTTRYCKYSKVLLLVGVNVARNM